MTTMTTILIRAANLQQGEVLLSVLPFNVLSSLQKEEVMVLGCCLGAKVTRYVRSYRYTHMYLWDCDTRACIRMTACTSSPYITFLAYAGIFTLASCIASRCLGGIGDSIDYDKTCTPCVRTCVSRSLGLKMHNPFGSGRGKNKKKGEASAAVEVDDSSEH